MRKENEAGGGAPCSPEEAVGATGGEPGAAAEVKTLVFRSLVRAEKLLGLSRHAG
jgi:hypothetical protein